VVLSLIDCLVLRFVCIVGRVKVVIWLLLLVASRMSVLWILGLVNCSISVVM